MKTVFSAGNTKHIVEEKVQHENRHTNDTLAEEKHENEGVDDNEEEYGEDDYDVEGGGMIQYCF